MERLNLKNNFFAVFLKSFQNLESHVIATDPPPPYRVFWAFEGGGEL